MRKRLRKKRDRSTSISPIPSKANEPAEVRVAHPEPEVYQEGNAVLARHFDEYVVGNLGVDDSEPSNMGEEVLKKTKVF